MLVHALYDVIIFFFMRLYMRVNLFKFGSYSIIVFIITEHTLEDLIYYNPILKSLKS